MVGFLVAYTVIAGLASNSLASWSVRLGLAESWFATFRVMFTATFVLLWLGHAVVW
jgi:hypothetical protein